MTKIELRTKLIEKIESIEDEALIAEILSLVEIENNLEYKFNSEQKELIHMAQKEVQNGETFTKEEIQKEMKEWLKK